MKRCKLCKSYVDNDMYTLSGGYCGISCRSISDMASQKDDLKVTPLTTQITDLQMQIKELKQENEELKQENEELKQQMRYKNKLTNKKPVISRHEK